MSFQSKVLLRYSQNFIKTDKLAKDIVDLTELDLRDNVIEIGAGKGVLTKYIQPAVNQLIAVEKDANLLKNLRVKFKNANNTKLINQDFLDYKLPINSKYKVIGNIPFALTTKIIKKLLESESAPAETYLILQKEAAMRFIGQEHKWQEENLFSLRFKPFFSSEIIKVFDKTDFTPKPGVNVVMIQIKKRDPPLVDFCNKVQYLDFITYCFSIPRKNLKGILKGVFTYTQIGIIRTGYKINLSLNPTKVNFETWLNLFNIYLTYSSEVKKANVVGSSKKLNFQQSKLKQVTRTRVVLTKNT